MFSQTSTDTPHHIIVDCQVEIWEPVGNPALVSLGESLTGGLNGSLNGSLEGHPLYSQLYTPIEQASFKVYVSPQVIIVNSPFNQTARIHQRRRND